jgi:hypothetical protein
MINNFVQKIIFHEKGWGRGREMICVLKCGMDFDE